MKKKIITALIIVLLILIVVLAIALGKDKPIGTVIGGGNEIGLINISGVIVSGSSGSDFFGGSHTGSASIIEQLRKAKENPNMPAVILYMNSPGGSAAASLEIGNEIQRLREEGKVVVSYMSDVAASGAYWIACETDLIIANPSTMTGSIGVIMQTMNLEEFYDMIGIDTNVVKSGEHKDMGAPHRDITEKEEAIFQSMVDDIYQQFLEVVSKSRKMDIERVKELADGRVYTGRQAFEVGLVDNLGDMHYAVEIAADLAGIEGEPNIVNMTPVSFWDEVFGQILFDRGFYLQDIIGANYVRPMLLPLRIAGSEIK